MRKHMKNRDELIERNLVENYSRYYRLAYRTKPHRKLQSLLSFSIQLCKK